MTDTLRDKIRHLVACAAKGDSVDAVTGAVLAVLAADYESDVAYERACEQLKRDNQELRATVARYREALERIAGVAGKSIDGEFYDSSMWADAAEEVARDALRGVGDTEPPPAKPDATRWEAKQLDAMKHDHKDPE